MNGVGPWVAVQPRDKPAAILGKLPMKSGVTHRFKIPLSVVPAGATGILVFAWVGVSAAPGGVSFWHVAVGVPGGGENFFSLLVDCSSGGSATNSQAFWLPMPADRIVHATLSGADLPNPSNQGEVEIHGYLPA